MLRRRVAMALLGLAVAMTVLLLGVLRIADEWIEDPALEDLMQHQLSFVLQQHVESGALAPELRFYRPAAGGPPPPEALLELEPGLHQEVGIGEESWRVLVRELGPGDRAYLAYALGFIERREQVLGYIAGGGILVLLLLAAWLSRRVAARALAPFAELVEQIRALDPQHAGQRLAAPEADGELAVIVDAINNHLTQLETLVERERAFAAGASHELRTPLALIQGSAEQLAAAPGAEPRVVERLRRGMREATQKLEALLALSRTREAPPHEALALAEWLPAASESLLAGDGSARVRWVTAPAQLVAPPGAARIVFGNLLQNALRADPAGEVSVTVAPGRVVVEDRGPGVPPEVLPHVFEPGFRGRQGGSGMGLYIARAVAERYGWRVSLQNREGGGARAEWSFAS